MLIKQSGKALSPRYNRYGMKFIPKMILPTSSSTIASPNFIRPNKPPQQCSVGQPDSRFLSVAWDYWDSQSIQPTSAVKKSVYEKCWAPLLARLYFYCQKISFNSFCLHSSSPPLWHGGQ